MGRFILFIALSSTAFASATPHFVKTVDFSSDGKKISQPQVIERSVAWLLKRAPNYWVTVNSFYCQADVESKDEPVEKLIQKAKIRGEQVKQELVARTIAAEKVEVIPLGKSENFSVCSAKILAGPSPVSSPSELQGFKKIDVAPGKDKLVTP